MRVDAAIKSPSKLLADLACVQALLQQRTRVAILTAGAPGSKPDQEPTAGQNGG